jgi:hypothetical protein
MPHATAGRLVPVGTRHFVAIAGVLALVCYVAIYTRPDGKLPLLCLPEISAGFQIADCLQPVGQ